MRRLLFPLTAMVFLLWAGSGRTAEITEVLDAADGKDPIDINVDVGFRSTLNRSKITHEWAQMWTSMNRPDYNELRFQETTYAMDYTFQIGMYHDLELYVNVPWIIQCKRQLGFVSGVSPGNSTLYRSNPSADPDFPGNAIGVDPSQQPSTTRSGVGDMQIGLKWAPFNDERDDTKSVWIIGLDYTIPSGKLAEPNAISGDKTGGVGLGHHVITPYLLFSRRFKVLDPYFGMQGSIPIQGREAQNAGFKVPYHGGFLTGMEIIPWEIKKKHQKFSIDVRLTTEFYGEVESKGNPKARGTVNEMSDFLVAMGDNLQVDANRRQLQPTGQYTQFGLHLGFAFRAAEFVRFRMGLSLAHNSEHFLTGADGCMDENGDGRCDGDPPNNYRVAHYDDAGRRLKVEESTLFTYWFTGMLTF